MNVLYPDTISDVTFLHLCASVTRGMTIYLGNFCLVPAGSWYYLACRRWNLEDRNVLLKYIDLRISKILSDLYMSEDGPLTPLMSGNKDIENAILGLEELCLTYETDSHFKSGVSIIISKMKHFLRGTESQRIDTEKNTGKDTAKEEKSPKFDPTLNHTLNPEIKKIKTWSEISKQSPPPFNSILNSIRSISLDSIHDLD